MKLRRTDTKRTPAERFSILVIPRNRSNIRRIEASSWSLKLVLGAGVLFVALLVGSFAAMMSYRSSYLATHSMRVESAKFAKERAQLASRIAELERAVARTQRFAAKIESVERGKPASVGLGPVDEQEAMPEIPESGRAGLGAGMWRSPFASTLSDGFDLSLDELAQINEVVEAKLHRSFAERQDKLYFWASLPTAWPSKGWVTSEFGASRGWRKHEGIDIAGPRGTPIIAPGDGIVTYTGYRRGYGKTLMIDHGYGISTVYGHCSSLYAEEGQRVKRGALIASVGNTGRSTGPHLHFEVHVDGVPVDPLLYLSSRI